MTNKTNRVLYIGVTDNLQGRVYQHKQKQVIGFTSRYNIQKLVYYEEYKYIGDAIRREKQIKNWHREWKISQIVKDNQKWDDLSKEWY